MSKELKALDDFVFEKGSLLEQSNNLKIVKNGLKILEIIRKHSAGIIWKTECDTDEVKFAEKVLYDEA